MESVWALSDPFLSLGLTVSVGAFSLVCISVERYLAICHPLLLLEIRSSRYSSFNHPATLTIVWLFSLLIAIPNFHMHRLCVLPTMRRFKCERSDSIYIGKRLYIVLLDGKDSDLHHRSSSYRSFAGSFLSAHSNDCHGDSSHIDYHQDVSKQHGNEDEISTK